MKNFYILIVILSLSLFNEDAYSQTESKQAKGKRPKVGLVLSGGGAKGFAYIGLFKVLKEIGLHIDYVGGASIGSIMAGFYAAGYDPDSITGIVRKINWDDVMQDKVKRKYIPFYDKQYGNPLIIQLPLDGPKKGGLSLKRSLYAGQNVELLLSRYFAKFYKYEDFNKLPIPMFCTATDLMTGESVILNKGNLEKAIRASMSIPGYFEPVHYDGKVLVDGGVVNNYPVVDMKNLGVNYVIGGDVQQGLEKDESKLNNIFSVIMQIISFSSLEATDEGLKNTDLYIHFDMGDYDMMSFKDYDSIIAIGERTARAHYDELKRLNDSLNALEYVPGNKFNTKVNDSVIIHDVKIEGSKKVSPRLINNALKTLENKKVSIGKLESEIEYLYGTGFFDLVTYRFEKPSKSDNKSLNDENAVNLIITVKEKGIGTIAAGIHYDNNYNIGLLLNAYFRNLLIKGSKLFINFNLSKNINFNFTYIMERGPHVGLGLSEHIYSFDFGEYDGKTKINELNFTNYKTSFFLTSTIKNEYNLRAGADYEYFRIKQNLNQDTTLDNLTQFNSYVTIFSDFRIDSWDKPSFPTKGSKFNVRAEYVMPVSKTWVKDIFNNSVIIYGSWYGNIALDKRKKFVLQPGAFAGFTINTNKNNIFPPINHWFGLGGLNMSNYHKTITPFMGTHFIQAFGLHTVIARLALQYNVYKKIYVSVRDDVGTIWGLDENYDDVGDLELPFYNGYGLTLGYDSFIGPAEITFMSSNIAGFSVFFSVGYWF